MRDLPTPSEALTTKCDPTLGASSPSESRGAHIDVHPGSTGGFDRPINS